MIGDVQTDLISESNLGRAAMMVTDLWVMSRLFGTGRGMENVPKTEQVRKKISFLEIAVFKFTAIAEHNI